MTGIPLPRRLPASLEDFPHYPHFKSAYDICIELERKLGEMMTTTPKSENLKRDMISCRILGYLLHHAPNNTARQHVQKEIVSCRDDESLIQLGEMYLNHYIRLFRSAKGQTPVPTDPPSRPSFDGIVEMTKEFLKEAPQNHSTAKKRALVRDGFRCVISGDYDCIMYEVNAEVRRMVEKENAQVRFTECTHILSESTNANLSYSGNAQYAATAWTILKSFGYGNLVNELNGEKIHRLENVLTLSSDLHRWFDALAIWFSATEIPNRYKLQSRIPYFVSKYPSEITFTTTDEKLPLPSPHYLALHATCAKVAYLSGAAEYIEKVLKDLEEIRVLSEDGSSARLLEDVLLGVISVA